VLKLEYQNLPIIFKVPTNYFDGQIKLFPDLYPAKFWIRSQNRSYCVSKHIYSTINHNNENKSNFLTNISNKKKLYLLIYNKDIKIKINSCDEQ